MFSLGKYMFFPHADPIFSFSPLAIHTRNLLADPRCTVVVQVCNLTINISILYILGFHVTLTPCRYLDGVACQMPE